MDQAIEALRNEADARLRQEQEPAKSEAKPGAPGASILEKDNAPGQTEASTAIELAAIRLIEAQRDRFEAIDLAVTSWESELSPQFAATPFQRLATSDNHIAQSLRNDRRISRSQRTEARARIGSFRSPRRPGFEIGHADGHLRDGDDRTRNPPLAGKPSSSSPIGSDANRNKPAVETEEQLGHDFPSPSFDVA